MLFKLSIITVAFFAAANFLPSAQAQPRRSNSIVWNEPNPPGVRNAALSIAIYNDATVTVAMQDGRLLSGEIDQVRADDFTLKTHFSPQPVSIPLVEVRSFRWTDPKQGGDPYAIKELATRLGQQPPATARLRLRNRQTLYGQVRDAAELEFTFVVCDSGDVKTLRYRDAQDLSDPGKTPAQDAKKILGNIGLVLAGMVAFPLVLLAVLTGWDGC
jgi:hypothetical protein